jgi:hypothetical protein
MNSRIRCPILKSFKQKLAYANAYATPNQDAQAAVILCKPKLHSTKELQQIHLEALRLQRTAELLYVEHSPIRECST